MHVLKKAQILGATQKSDNFPNREMAYLVQTVQASGFVFRLWYIITIARKPGLPARKIQQRKRTTIDIA